ncbi:MAG: hypothetical protein EOO22_08410, partial [Comamonadaceae bacterium]
MHRLSRNSSNPSIVPLDEVRVNVGESTNVVLPRQYKTLETSEKGMRKLKDLGSRLKAESSNLKRIAGHFGSEIMNGNFKNPHSVEYLNFKKGRAERRQDARKLHEEMDLAETKRRIQLDQAVVPIYRLCLCHHD